MRALALGRLHGRGAERHSVKPGKAREDNANGGLGHQGRLRAPDESVVAEEHDDDNVPARPPQQQPPQTNHRLTTP